MPSDDRFDSRAGKPRSSGRSGPAWGADDGGAGGERRFESNEQSGGRRDGKGSGGKSRGRLRAPTGPTGSGPIGGPIAGGSIDFGGIAPDGFGHAAPSHRLAQVNSLIARVLRDRLARGINDPRVQGMVSVLGVECTPDFYTAQVRISVLPADRARLTLSGLRSATRHLEGVVRKETRLRKVPRLSFALDDSIKREAAMSESLQRAQGFTPADQASDVESTPPDPPDTPTR
jgi:ribosome-binding factor A